MLSGAQRIGLVVMLMMGAALGTLWGLRSVPPSDTAIIDAAAADYVAQTGGTPTDCAARPSALPEVRLVVICAEGAWVSAFDTYGRQVTVDRDKLEEDPLT
jgi:hypothetical protein